MAKAIEATRKDNSAITEVQTANSAFHHLLLDAAGSQRLKSILETMIDMPIIPRSLFLYDIEDLQRRLQHHKSLVLALELRHGQIDEQIGRDQCREKELKNV